MRAENRAAMQLARRQKRLKRWVYHFSKEVGNPLALSLAKPLLEDYVDALGSYGGILFAGDEKGESEEAREEERKLEMLERKIENLFTKTMHRTSDIFSQ